MVMMNDFIRILFRGVDVTSYFKRDKVLTSNFDLANQIEFYSEIRSFPVEMQEIILKCILQYLNNKQGIYFNSNIDK